MLLERAGQVVSREELQKALWPADTFVDFDHGLNKAINKIREALGDSAESPRFVETVARRGYRFIADIKVADTALPSSPDAALAPHSAPDGRARDARPAALATPRWVATSRGWAIAALALIVLLGSVAGWNRYTRSREPSVSVSAVLPLESLSNDASRTTCRRDDRRAISDLGQSALRVISPVVIYKPVANAS